MMAMLLRKVLPFAPSTTIEEDNDNHIDYSYSYSFAAEYSGPLISHEIPRAVPLDISLIPIASKLSSSSLSKDVLLPVIQPIVKSKLSNKKPSHSKDTKLGSNDAPSESTNRVDKSSTLVHANGNECVSKSFHGIESSDRLNIADGDKCGSKVSDDVQNSNTGLCNDHNSSHVLCGNSQMLELHNHNKDDSDEGFQDYVNLPDGESVQSDLSSTSKSSEIFSGKDDCIEDDPSHARRTPAVTFEDPDSSDVYEEEYDTSEDESNVPVRQMAIRPGKKGTCYRCMKGSRLTKKEICIVCGAKYCYKCVLRAMGSMPEGRKCVTCIGQKIDETKRKFLGKCYGMLEQLLPELEVKKIMNSERFCEVNQLTPELVYVNRQCLSQEGLFLLQNCQYPPKKLKPGYYWYDKVSGFWGKEGQKPCQMITPQLAVGGHLQQDASNGNTNILINSREITKQEKIMLQLIGVKYKGATHFWVSPDGSYQEEGMNNVKGKIWETNRAKLICAVLSLPIPPGSASPSAEEVNTVPKSFHKQIIYRFLLAGYGKSGTSTIYKHAKIIYSIPFSEDERQNIKQMIQSNLYGYLGILLEACEQFEKESLIKKKRCFVDQCSSSSGQIENKTMYSIGPRVKPFSDWLLRVMMSGNLEAVFPAAAQEYAPFVEELWNDAAFQATYNRRHELELLPRVATYFIERAVEISKKEYEPSDMDILYAEGLTLSKGLSSMEFTFPKKTAHVECEDDGHNPSQRYQLVRVHPRTLGGNCKWLEMFEEIDMVLFCVSLTDYNEFVEDRVGVVTNKMVASKQLFESIVKHPTFKDKKFLLILNKFDLLEEKIEQSPLAQCEWFQDFNPVIGHNPCSSRSKSTNASLAHRAFQYIAVKFKRLFYSLTGGNKLFVSQVTALEPDNVDEALRYAREILMWQEKEREEPIIELSSASIEASSSS